MRKFKKAPLPKRFSFLMISRILKQKGVFEYFDAAKIVKTIYPDIRFIYIGAVDKTKDSFSMEILKNEYIDKGVVEYVEETNDVVPFITNSTVMVLPSYREGVPRTLLEALSIGRPIITTEVPGCKETVKEGINGFKVPLKDKNALVERMIFMIENKDKLQRMAEESHKYCKERFDVNIINIKMLEILKI